MSIRPRRRLAGLTIVLATLSLTGVAPAQPVDIARNYGARAGAPPPEDCVPMNPDRLTIVVAGGGFSVFDGSSMLASFPTKTLAVGVINVLRKYGFTQECFLGRGGGDVQVGTSGLRTSHFQYFKRNGAVPHIVRDSLREDCIQIPANENRVALYGNTPGMFSVVSGGLRGHADYLLSFPHDQASAERAAAILNRYHIDQECFVGRGSGATFDYWLT